jgi:hypothetical protein
MLMLSWCFLLAAFTQTAVSPKSSPDIAPVAKPAPPPVSVANSITPADPKERLELGRRLNGLQGTDIQPWHMKASYEVFDADGKSKDKGTSEEWRVNEKQYKLAYHSAQFSHEEYGTDHGVFHAGDKGWPGFPVSQLRSAIVQPLPARDAVEPFGQRNLERKFGNVQLPCTALSYHGGKEVDETSPSFCFDPDQPILRYSNSSNRINQTILDHFTLFAGRYVAHDIRLLFLGKPSLTIHIDLVEPLGIPDPSALSVPAGTLPVRKRIVLSAVESGVDLIKKVPPVYPETAKIQHVQGMVILAATTSRDGRITEVHPLAGPQLLQKPAMDAVRQWLYKPYLLDGDPVEVDTQVYVIFNLGGR